MSTVILDAATRDKILAAAGDTVELRDEAGKLIGRVVRPLGPPTPPPGYEIVGEWPDEEEIERRLREGKWYTTAEVIAHLRTLDGKDRGAGGMIVVWHEDALDRLADIYVTASPADRERLAEHMVRTEERLRDDPSGLGESRHDAQHRMWFTPPLVVGFRLLRDPPRVQVYHLAATRSRPNRPG